MTNLQRIHDCDMTEAAKRALSDELLVAMGWQEATVDIGFFKRPDGVVMHRSRLPHPMASVDDALALAGDGWMLVLLLAYQDLEAMGEADLKMLAPAICEALAMMVEKQDE